MLDHRKWLACLVMTVAFQAQAELQDPTRPVFVTAPASTLQAQANDYRLSSIQIQSGRRTAMINGETLQEGQMLGQATVSRIESDHVVIQNGDQQRSLYLYSNTLKKVIRKAP